MGSPPPHDLASRIRALRLSRGWNQERLALESGVSLSYLKKIEQGHRDNLGGWRLTGLASALDVSERFLLTGQEIERDGAMLGEFATLYVGLNDSGRLLALDVLRAMAARPELSDEQPAGLAVQNPKVRVLHPLEPQDAVPEAVDTEAATEEDGDTDQYDPKNPAHAAHPEHREIYEDYRRNQPSTDPPHEDD